MVISKWTRAYLINSKREIGEMKDSSARPMADRTQKSASLLIMLASPVLLLAACGNPCLDDGFVNRGQACEEDVLVTDDDDASGHHDSATGDSDGDGDDDDDSSSNPGDDSSDGLQACRDRDGDGFGDAEECMIFDTVPSGGDWVTNDDDCDDEHEQTFPGAAENESDDDACMRDADEDGWGDTSPNVPGVVDGTDCDDNDGNAFPGAAADESGTACMKDADGDDWGDENPDNPDVTPGQDCDDSESSTFRGAAPLDDPAACMTDADNDDWGDATPSNPLAQAGTDCLDTDAAVYPGAAASEGDACTRDADNDGWGDNDPPSGVIPGQDCDDGSATTFPGAAPQDDANACMKDDDGDDFGDVDNQGQDDIEVGSDCVDADPEINPDQGDNDCLTTLALALPDNYNINAGDSVTLQAVGSGGSGDYAWAWTPTAALDADDIAQPSATPTTTSTYTVTLTDTVTGQSLTDTVTVHVIDDDVKIGECAPSGIFNIGGFEIDAAATGGLIQEAQWASQDAGQSLCQLNNNQPSAVICTDWLLHDAAVTGQLVINPNPAQNNGNPDDDWVGFVWGVQPGNQHYYLFSWKASFQGAHAGCPNNGAFEPGMYIKRIDQTAAELNCQELLSSSSDNGYVVLAQPDQWDTVAGNDLAQGGWEAGETYVFHLEHREDHSIVQVRSQDGSDSVEVRIDDDTYSAGYFGVFTFSQDHACFSEYTTTGL